MQIKLENLQKLVKEVLSETYLGTSTQGNLANPAFNLHGPMAASSTEIAVDPVELAEKIRSLIGGDAGFPIGEWGDEALNSAAEAAADALINTEQREKMSRSVRLYEQKNSINEIRKVLQEVEPGVSDSAMLATAINKMISILDSMDMTLDLIYGSVSGHEGPISAVRGLQKSYGRAMSPVSKTNASE